MSNARQLKYVLLALLVIGVIVTAVKAYRYRRVVTVIHNVEKVHDTYQKTMYGTYLVASGLLGSANKIRGHHDQVAASSIGQDPQQSVAAGAILSRDKALHNAIAIKYNAMMAQLNWVLCDATTLPPGASKPLPHSIELLP